MTYLVVLLRHRKLFHAEDVGIIGVTVVVMTEKSHAVDETTDLKAKFARFRCKSIKRKSFPRFNTGSFSPVHSREKLWSITVCCLGRKGGREEEKRFLYFCVSITAAEGLFI